MIKATTLSLFSGGLLAAGLAYAYARQARARHLAAEGAEPSLFEATLLSDVEPSSFDEPTSDDEIELEIELVDLDAMTDEEEAYDATSPDNLGALWLSRATQTSGVRTSPGIEDEAFEDEDDLDPAGRPTEPPAEPVIPSHPRTNGA